MAGTSPKPRLLLAVWWDGSGAAGTTLGTWATLCALAGCRVNLSQRPTLTLDDRKWSPRLLMRANGGLYLDPHSVQVGKQCSVLLPGGPISARLLVQEVGKQVTATVQLRESSVNLSSGDVLGLGAGCHH